MGKIIKIFVAHHMPWDVYEDDIFVPIQVGKNNSKVDLWILWDNTWDNISYLNDKYSELTQQYWVWKNYDLTNVDYVWFFHYRRFFDYSTGFSSVFNLFNLIKNFWINRQCYNLYREHVNFLSRKNVDFRRIGLKISNYISRTNFDIYLPKSHHALIWKHLCTLHTSNKRIRELIVESIKEMTPLYYTSTIDTIKNYGKQFSVKKYNHRNMFIMNKFYFLKYMDFQFKILFKLYDLLEENNLWFSDSHCGNRTMWYYSESFINFFTAFECKYCGCRVSRDANILFLED